METLVHVNNVSKKFARSLKRAMTYGLIDIAKAALIPQRYRSENLPSRLTDARRPTTDDRRLTKDDRRPTNDERRRTNNDTPLRATEFWALQNVSFDLHAGECLGIIGHNGAGKSTLFSILAGIYGPTEGRVEIRGKLQALIALGAGFHPMLSGRENIYINAAILGLTTRQVNAIYDSIVAFSELEEFIDMPIRNYSSGMLVRLGFSVAAHLEPDLLLVDEVLAVGDMSFQRKCLAYMQKLYERNATVILVSHNLPSIEAVAQRVIWLDKGRVRADGRPGEVIAAYAASQMQKTLDSEKREDVSGTALVLDTDEWFAVESIKTTTLEGLEREAFHPGEPIVIQVDYFARCRIERPHFHFTCYCGTTRVFDASMLLDGQAPESVEGHGTLKCVLPNPNLMPNTYKVSVAVRSKEAVYDLFTDIKKVRFMVCPEDQTIGNAPCAVSLQVMGALVSQEYRWEIV